MRLEACGSWAPFYPMARDNDIAGCWEIEQFPIPSFSTDFYTDHGTKNVYVLYTYAKCLEALMLPATFNPHEARNE